MIPALISLRAAIDDALRVLARVAPAVELWQQPTTRKAPWSPQDRLRPRRAPACALAKPASPTLRQRRRGNGQDQAAAGDLVRCAAPECDQTFRQKRRGGLPQRFCSGACRSKANLARRRERTAAPQNAIGADPAAEPPPALACPDRIPRPFRGPPVPASGHSDPARLAPPPLPWEA